MGRIRGAMKRFVCMGLVCALFLSSCSLVMPGKQDVDIVCDNKDAFLYADGNPLGYGRAQVKLSRGKDHVISAELPDGRTANVIISKELSVAGKLDLLGTLVFLVPMIGLLSNGAWTLDRDAVFLHMPHEKQ